MWRAMNLTNENFESSLKDNSLILVDFWAEWCGPCKKLSPILDEIGEEYRLVIGKLDTDAFPEISERYEIRSIPTMILFENSVPIKIIVGARPKHILVRELEEWL
jgi:thioredoxin 1